MAKMLNQNYCLRVLRLLRTYLNIPKPQYPRKGVTVSSKSKLLVDANKEQDKCLSKKKFEND